MGHHKETKEYIWNHDFDKRFRLEDEGKVHSGKSFRWKMIQWLDEHEGEEEVPWVM